MTLCLRTYNTAGVLMDRYVAQTVTRPEIQETELRILAEVMARLHGQKSWKFDLYDGATLKATYKRGVWTEHKT
jgi:hypothetical protein